MSKQFWGLIIVILLILVGIFTITNNKSSSGSKGSVGPTNHVEGSASSGVKLVEYGDYECPFCEQYSTTISQVVQQYSSKIQFQFRNFPLTSVHPNAFAAARAAEAAGLQGKFWQMHDALYNPSNWQSWSGSSSPSQYFYSYATELGLNLNQFKTDFASSRVNDTVNADMAAGNKLNITATPTFFLDGKQVQIGNSLADFQKVIDAEIANKTGSNTTTPTSSGTTEQTKQ